MNDLAKHDDSFDLETFYHQDHVLEKEYKLAIKQKDLNCMLAIQIEKGRDRGQPEIEAWIRHFEQHTDIPRSERPTSVIARCAALMIADPSYNQNLLQDWLSWDPLRQQILQFTTLAKSYRHLLSSNLLMAMQASGTRTRWNAPDICVEQDRITALHVLIAYGSPAALTGIQLGMDVHAKTALQETPLNYALAEPLKRQNRINDALIQALLNAGADPLYPNQQGETPVDLHVLPKMWHEERLLKRIAEEMRASPGMALPLSAASTLSSKATTHRKH